LKAVGGKVENYTNDKTQNGTDPANAEDIDIIDALKLWSRMPKTIAT
jgi:hypothetical protein